MNLPQRLRRFLAILDARNKEFLRDRQAMGWNLALPLLIVVGFAFIFTGGNRDVFKVGVYDPLGQAQAAAPFLALEHIQFIPMDSLDTAILKVERHQVDLLLDPADRRYWVNDKSERGYLVERLLLANINAPYQHETVSGREIRYVDWVWPGVLAMNIMFSALFGIGYVIVRYRKNGVLKRLKATPLGAVEFLAAQIVSRLWLIVAVSTFVYFATDLIVDFAMFGSYLNLLVVLVMGAISLISLGLLVAARISSEELADGLLNLISWPMMFLSGVWFSLEGINPWFQKFAQVFPLTHMIDAARAVILDGASLVDIAPSLLALAAMSLVFLAIGALGFRWE